MFYDIINRKGQKLGISMKNKKEILRNILLFITLIVITFVVIFHNNDFKQTINIILSVKFNYILLGIITMIFYFVLEALNIKNILKKLGNNISIFSGIKYSLIGFFFSGITPAATGGQPMEIYYMKKEKIPVTHSTLALLLQLCSFHITTIICGIIGLILNHQLLSKGFIWLFIVGLVFKAIALITMLICLFSQKLSRKIVNIFIKILEKIKFKNIEDTKQKIDNSLKEYNQGSKFIKNNKKIFIQSLFIVLIQIIIYYTIPYFVYRSFNLIEYSIFKIIFIQAMLFVSASSIPLPGSVGISESAFISIYLAVFGTEKLASATLLNRGINFYLFVLIGFLVTLYSTLKQKKHI